MKLIWVSDIHLNFLEFDRRKEFYVKLKESEGDLIVISGDIAESRNIVPLLMEAKFHAEKEIYFVLGNHDFYGSNIASVKSSVRSLGYLGSEQYVALNASTVVIGVDGWGDCRYGDYKHSRLTMSDWMYINDLSPLYHIRQIAEDDPLKSKLQQLADNDARKLKRRVDKAIKNGYNKIIIVSHVPPFEEASLYAGKKSTPDGLPFFASKCLGRAILPIAEKHSEVDFLWLSGHTHNRAVYAPLENLKVRVAAAEYYRPQIEDIIEI